MNNTLTSTSRFNPMPFSVTIPGYLTKSTNSVNLQPGGNRVTIPLGSNVVIPDGCNIDLISGTFSFTQPNIFAAGQLQLMPNGNNRITITFGGGAATDYSIPTGLYEVADVQFALNQIAITNGWITPASATQQLFILTGVEYTQSIIMTLDPAALTGSVSPAGGIVVSFRNPSVATGNNDSMGEVLGFGTGATTYTLAGGATTAVSFAASGVSDFGATSAYALYMSWVSGSYQNGQTGQLVYVFGLGGQTPNSVITYAPPKRFPCPLIANIYTAVDVWMTDQNGNPLPWKYFQTPTQFLLMLSKNRPDGAL